jgi:hypothetical protein
MLVIAATVWSVRARISSMGTTPGRMLWGGPSHAGGLATIALATRAGGRAGRSKKLIAACYEDGLHGESLSCSCLVAIVPVAWRVRPVLRWPSWRCRREDGRRRRPQGRPCRGRAGAQDRPFGRPGSPARTSEPDVRVSTHPALHEPMPAGYDDAWVVLVHGVGIRVPR